MKGIYQKFIATLLLGTMSAPSLFADENNESNNVEIDMTQIEKFYQDRQSTQQVQHDSSYFQGAQYQVEELVYEAPQVQEDIRARRLREWQEQHQTVPVQMQQSNNSRSVSPEPEADDLFAAAINGNTAKIGTLLAQGLDINISNHERETALHMAAARGHYSTVIYLINHGAYSNARTVKSWIPLHHAVRFRHPNIVNYLIKRGSSPFERTTDGLSAIDMAKGMNNYRLLSILGAR